MHGEEFRRRFSHELARCLNQRYGAVPSAETLARDFSIHSGTGQSITRETARKWLRGMAFPDLGRLAYLINWLNLDMVNVFGHLDKSVSSKPETIAQHNSIDSALVQKTDGKFMEVFNNISPDQQSALLQFARAFGHINSREPLHSPVN